MPGDSFLGCRWALDDDKNVAVSLPHMSRETKKAEKKNFRPRYVDDAAAPRHPWHPVGRRPRPLLDSPGRRPSTRIVFVSTTLVQFLSNFIDLHRVLPGFLALERDFFHSNVGLTGFYRVFFFTSISIGLMFFAHFLKLQLD